MKNLATEVSTSNADQEDVVVKIIRVAAPPLAISEANCEQNGLGPHEGWLTFLRRWKIAYRRNGDHHIALTADVESAIRAGATTNRPGPKPGSMPKTPLPKKPDATVAQLLERSGFKRAGGE
jgi:hypothetical protein